MQVVPKTVFDFTEVVDGKTFSFSNIEGATEAEAKESLAKNLETLVQRLRS